MAKVTIYTTPSCMFCNAAKKYFEENGIDYTEKDLSLDQEARKEIMYKGFRSAPIISVDNEFVVGFDEEKLAELLK